ncbi:Putative DNA-binding domain-containing protein [Limimonas halophila]|uniref:Putative DNA-binding domain-containing protein n=1 Tax=Limimonas halophila TaxID=1082479 RepID=A0A1G7T5Q2_9PROT|nr:ATP-binding protein [Limimonas halophila]SDG30422.1 Putative DNA-binding domain-containing protein [Limimonas halophila]
MAKKNKLTRQEVSLIKAMINTGYFNNQEILSFFSYPERTVNQGRISQIQDGKIYHDVSPATYQDLKNFLDNYNNSGRYKFHPESKEELFRILPEDENDNHYLNIDESDIIECKKSFQLNAFDEYSRTICGMANNKGGYIVFGVQDNDWKIVGLKDKKFWKEDTKKINNAINSRVSPSVYWKRLKINRGGEDLAVLYVQEAPIKPVMIKKDGQKISEGQIYYRYSGENNLIRIADLQNILQERDRQIEQRWHDLIQRVGKIGAENVGILNTVDGMVEGPGGSLYIDESLLGEINFIRHGRLSETEGAPTLRIVGEVEPVTTVLSDTGKVEIQKDVILETDILEAFMKQSNIKTPKAYLKALSQVPSWWGPLYYYVYLSGMTRKQAVSFLESTDTSFSSARNKKVQILKNTEMPKTYKISEKIKPIRDKIINKDEIDLGSLAKARQLLHALQSLNPDEVDFPYCLSLVHNVYESYYSDAKSEIRKTLALLDYYEFSHGLS